ncbi:uncharacterized protein LOC111075241 [Drosophila obscura]|uniref:uncharacterized protein LOC111075241 n=1 Tax=Drosophila obscura TaxID=7282 RepID=UPI001BB1C5B1|nr:uncharacterized protein LOC111075241 [Drosophila obscura]
MSARYFFVCVFFAQIQMVKVLLLKNCCFVVKLLWGCYFISGIMWLESLAFGWQCFTMIRYSGFYILVTLLHFVKLFNAIILLYGLLNQKRALVAIFLMTLCVCMMMLLVHCLILIAIIPTMRAVSLETGHYVSMFIYFACYFFCIWVIYSYFILSREPPPEEVAAVSH